MRMTGRSFIRYTCGLALTGTLAFAPAEAQQPATSPELQDLKLQVQGLKNEQRAINIELQEIRKLLQAQGGTSNQPAAATTTNQPPRPPSIVDLTGTISVVGDPAQGSK